LIICKQRKTASAVFFFCLIKERGYDKIMKKEAMNMLLAIADALCRA